MFVACFWYSVIQAKALWAHTWAIQCNLAIHSTTLLKSFLYYAFLLTDTKAYLPTKQFSDD